MSKRGVALAFATWFYTGYAPVAPGTVGALCAWGPAWILAAQYGVPPWAFAVAAAVMAPAGAWSAAVAAEQIGSKDPARIVIDEVVGQWIALVPVEADSWPQWCAALVLFRFFDIAKPFGIRRLEALPGGVGIMADDVGAGACAMLGVILVRWIGY